MQRFNEEKMLKWQKWPPPRLHGGHVNEVNGEVLPGERWCKPKSKARVNLRISAGSCSNSPPVVLIRGGRQFRIDYASVSAVIGLSV